MDFTFTPEQEALREQAREFLAANPEPTWLQLAELGWTGVSIDEEDGGAGLSFVEEAVLEVQIRKLVALARDRGADQLQRDRIAREWVELQALRWTAYRSLSALERTGLPGPEGSILKLQWSEANQRVTKLALELLGPDAPLADGNAPYGGYWQYQQLRSRGNTIEAGTSEILRNIVAERVLGLPKSR
jgi:alkylation response protein AidB-like acyl-CoA dehydrogenase